MLKRAETPVEQDLRALSSTNASWEGCQTGCARSAGASLVADRQLLGEYTMQRSKTALNEA